MTSPEAFLVGTIRGTSSLVRRTIASLCRSVSHFSESMQVGLIALGVIDPTSLSLHSYQLMDSSTDDDNSKSVDSKNENKNRIGNSIKLNKSETNETEIETETERIDDIENENETLTIQQSVGKNVRREKEDGRFFSVAQDDSLLRYNGRPRNGLEGFKQGREEGVYSSKMKKKFSSPLLLLSIYQIFLYKNYLFFLKVMKSSLTVFKLNRCNRKKVKFCYNI